MTVNPRFRHATAAFIWVVLLVLALGSAALADDVRVDVVINGERLADAAIVHGDRTFVDLEDVARVLDGRYVYDESINVAFVLTGRYKSLMADTLAELNPDLDGYYPIARFVAGRGVHYGLSAAHVTISFLTSGLATAFTQIMAEGELTHHPWFDQTPGKFERFLSGDGYSQHLYVVDRTLIKPGGDTQVAFNGKALNLGTDHLLPRDKAIYVRLRALAEASGGGVSWDVAERVASAKIESGEDLSWGTLASLNMRTIRYYGQGEAPFVPSIGYRHVTPGPGLIVGTDGEELVAVFGGIFPSENDEWFPWYDQPHGQAREFPDVGPAFSQHIYLVKKEDIYY